eukprot:2863739-Pyramimonas_sp.AAC.2
MPWGGGPKSEKTENGAARIVEFIVEPTPKLDQRGTYIGSSRVNMFGCFSWGLGNHRKDFAYAPE